MVKFKVLLKNAKGESLNKWLENHPTALDNSRLIYVLKSRADPSVFKIGIAGELGDPKRRLREYQLMYGNTDEPMRNKQGKLVKENGQVKTNPCSGADLYYLGTTKYNAKVEWRKSAVYEKELFLKRKLKNTPGFSSIRRGPERSRIHYNDLMKLMESKNFLEIDEKPGYIRKSQREPKQRVVQSNDKIVKVIGHRLGARGQKTRYRATWSRPDKKGNPNTDELASFIVAVPGGKEALKAYKKHHASVSWKD